MNVSRLASHGDQPQAQARKTPGGQGFSWLLNRELEKAGTPANAPPDASAAATNLSIAPKGTPNSLLEARQLLDLGGGVYYNTGNRTYQDLTGSIVGTDGASVQQYTDPETFLAGGAAYEASDARLRATVTNLDELVPSGVGSPTFILNARWAYEKLWGSPPVTTAGTPAWEHQESPVTLEAFPGVLKAPWPPPLAGTIPPPWNAALDMSENA